MRGRGTFVRTDHVATEERLEIHPHDTEQRGIVDGDGVRIASRAGETSLRADVTDRAVTPLQRRRSRCRAAMPVAFVVNGTTFAVLLASPENRADCAASKAWPLV